MSKRMLSLTLAIFLAAIAGQAFGQNLAQDALSSFPADTVHIEFSSPQRLRSLASYNDLRHRFVGQKLVDLETTLGKLGIQESQIDDLVLGWRPSGSTMELFGLASGHFDIAGIKKSAQQRGIAPENLGGSPAYCVGAGVSTECALIFDSTHGAFGTLETLSDIMDVRQSAKPSVGSNSGFSQLVDEAPKQDPIWGVAEGPGVADWFNGWISNASSVQLDWTKVFSNVDSLTYGIETGDNVKIALRLNCNSPDSATSLRQVLEGLRLAQQLAWQHQSPNQPDPFEGTEIELNGSEVTLKMAATFGQLGKLQSIGAQ